LDAIKAARLAGVSSVTLTTTKSPKGFIDNQYVMDRSIKLDKLTKATVLFSGTVFDAIKAFPQNINVAASLTLAVGDAHKLKVCIIADPKVNVNTHEIYLKGAFGCLSVKVENKVCPDNPKTSYLAVLSAIQTLKQFASNVKIGT
jgi:aspartate dehydrogenase